MPRSRSPDSIKAEKLFLNKHKSLVEIAKILKVPEGTVRSWKNRYGWDSIPKKDSKKNECNVANENKNATLHKKKTPPKRKPGGQPGNLNAYGNNGGAPKGSHNALKHGGYSLADWGVFSDEEGDLINGRPEDLKDQLQEEIDIYTIREHRLIRAINKYNGLKGGLYVSNVMRSENKRTFKSEEEKQQYEDIQAGKVEAGEKLPGTPYQITTTTGNATDIVLRLEKELSTVQRAKDAAIAELKQLQKLDAETEAQQNGTDAVSAWMEAVRKSRGDTDDRGASA